MEICIDSLESAANALEGGAMRLEVCSALSEGGLTPTPGLVRAIRRISKVPIYAMIRVRQGDFLYTTDEIDAMLYDLSVLKGLGVDGFVFGALTERGEIDRESCERILSAAHPLPITFHRAFDKVSKPFEALEILIKMGFERVLTSGQRKSAEEGLETIEELVRQANNRIIVMPGAGVTVNNIRKIKLKSGAKEFHASAKEKRMSNSTGSVNIGANVDDDCVMVTNAKLVAEMVDALSKAPL